MVKLGFIGEGANEKTILESAGFRSLLSGFGLEFVGNVIDASGGGNLLPKYLEDQINSLKEYGATHILILADQEDEPCITSVKSRIDPDGEYIIVIAVKAIEAWFLADSTSISSYLRFNYQCDLPEEILKPFAHIKQIKLERTGRGVNHKMQLCSRMLQCGFSIENAATHPNCPSASYFLKKLKSLANG
jgi:hypothetical protein